MMIDYVIDTTKAFIDEMPKDKRKKKGQFFTSKETACFMADMFDFSLFGKTVRLLDPGAGTGILTAAFLDRAEHDEHIERIQIVCYEKDVDVLPLLKSNLEYMKQHCRLDVQYTVFDRDYLLSQADNFEGRLFPAGPSYENTFDGVLCNPPYLKIMRDSDIAMSMGSVVHGAPNLYFLFAAMSLFNLKPGQEMVYIMPRSWTSGEYFKAFRNYLFGQGSLEWVHLFVSRDKVFKEESVLQETLIIKVKKATAPRDCIVITSCANSSDFQHVSKVVLPYGSVISGSNEYVYLPTNEAEVETIERVNRFDKTLPDDGYRMRTGIVVDFREQQYLRDKPGKNTVPLFYSQHIRDGRVGHECSGKKFDWISCEKPALVQKNENYVFCKRFTAKEEKRRLQCGVYLADDFPEYSYIGTQNKINYVTRVDNSSLTKKEAYGLYALLNSSLYDRYYRILNGSTQVNSSEINHMPVPSADIIRQLGEKVMKSGDLSTAGCDKLIGQIYHE